MESGYRFAQEWGMLRTPERRALREWFLFQENLDISMFTVFFRANKKNTSAKAVICYHKCLVSTDICDRIHLFLWGLQVQKHTIWKNNCCTTCHNNGWMLHLWKDKKTVPIDGSCMLSKDKGSKITFRLGFRALKHKTSLFTVFCDVFLKQMTPRSPAFIEFRVLGVKSGTKTRQIPHLGEFWRLSFIHIQKWLELWGMQQADSMYHDMLW